MLNDWGTEPVMVNLTEAAIVIDAVALGPTVLLTHRPESSPLFRPVKAWRVLLQTSRSSRLWLLVRVIECIERYISSWLHAATSMLLS